MIEAAIYLRNRFQRVLPQYQRFLDSIGASPAEYKVAPEPGRGIVVAVYEPDNFGVYSYTTNVRVSAGAGVAFTTGLDSALYLTAEIFADPDALVSLGSVDLGAPEQDLLAHFGLKPEMLKPKVAGWATGTFIAPDGDGYALFGVDTHGEISIEARSANLAGVAFYFATWQRAEAADLSSRIAKFADAG